MKPYYQDAWATIYHGDCRDVLPTLEPVDCVITSPPYNQLSQLPENGSGMWGNSHGGAGFLRKWAEDSYEDSMGEDDYQGWQNNVIASIKTKGPASLFYNHQLRWRDKWLHHPVAWFKPDGWFLRQEIIWDKAGGMMMNARMFCRFDERILWFTRTEWKWNQSEVGNGTIWRIARFQQQQGKSHPVAFPIAIPSRCIAAATDAGDTILDPFMGSGTTLRAAKDLGRKSIGIEIEEKYCAIAAQRLEQGVLEFPVETESVVMPELFNQEG